MWADQRVGRQCARMPAHAASTDKTCIVKIKFHEEARHGKSFEGLLNRYFADELKMEAFEKKLENIAKKLGLA